MRMVIVQNKNNTVSCIQMSQDIQHYIDRYDVITIVNKPWNPHFVMKIKNYFNRKRA